MSWRGTLESLKKLLDNHDENRTFKLKGKAKRKFGELEDKLKDQIVRDAAGKELEKAEDWVKKFKISLDVLKRRAGVEETLMTRELRSFLESPENHLKKKILFYLHDLLRGAISEELFEEKAYAAVKTSLKTNLRTVYQDWVFVSLIGILSSHGGVIVYPQHKVFSLERSGMQRIGWIPPNVIIRLPKLGYLSFFIEAPRPVGWGDSRDLRRIWKLYTALRPDMMVYGGEVMDIVDLSSDPPVKKPDVIIEVKELEDWHVRMREVRGPFARPLTVERWRSKWIEGLWDGLAEILGVERRKAREQEKRRVLRLRDVQVVRLYKAFYKPKSMIVITRCKTPGDVKEELEGDGISVIDEVRFEEEKLVEVVTLLGEVAVGEREVEVRFSGKLYSLLKRVASILGVEEEEAAKAAVRMAAERSEELLRYVKEEAE